MLSESEVGDWKLKISEACMWALSIYSTPCSHSQKASPIATFCHQFRHDLLVMWTCLPCGRGNVYSVMVGVNLHPLTNWSRLRSPEVLITVGVLGGATLPGCIGQLWVASRSSDTAAPGVHSSLVGSADHVIWHYQKWLMVQLTQLHVGVCSLSPQMQLFKLYRNVSDFQSTWK